MSVLRMQKRVKSATKMGIAQLTGHELRFHKVSKDGSGKCDAFETGDQEHLVWGVIYEILPEHRQSLDRAEGLGVGYDVKDISLNLNGEPISAFTYYATEKNSSLKPFHWYKEHVSRGAVDARFPTDYIQMIQAVESVADSDNERHEREMSIYSSL